MERMHVDLGPKNGSAMSAQSVSCLSNFVEKAKLELVVNAESISKLYAIKPVLQQTGVEEFLESSLLCHGEGKGRKYSYRGVNYTPNIEEKIKLEMLVPVDAVEFLARLISDFAKAERIGDWRLCFIPQVFPINLIL
jgi:nitrogen regulatory protein PII